MSDEDPFHSLSSLVAHRSEGKWGRSYIRAQIESTSRWLELLEERLNRVRFESRPAAVLQSTRNELGFLRAERATWILLKHTRKDDRRRRSRPQLAPSFLSTLPNRQDVFRHDVPIKRFLEQDELFSRADAITRWLEEVARFDVQITVQLESANVSSVFRSDRYMQNTLLLLSRGTGHGRRLVSSLDPDARFREQAAVHIDDAEEEAALMRQVWELVRAGRVNDAATLCKNHLQYWRAAALSGAKMWRDRGVVNDTTVVAGNKRRLLWRQLCRRLATSPQATMEDCLIFGVLGGALPAVLPLFRSWEDVLWAHCREVCERRKECVLKCVTLQRKHEHAIFGSEEAADMLLEDTSSQQAEKEEECVALQCANDGVNPHSLESLCSVFQWIENQPLFAEASHDPFHALQTSLALSRDAEALRSLAQCVIDPRFNHGPFLRFSANLCLHISAVLPTTRRAEADQVTILRTFIAFLKESNRPELVALYAQYLPAPEQIQLYAAFLKELPTTAERRRLLRRANEFFPENVPQVTKTLVEMVYADTNDAAKIEVLACFAVDDPELTVQSNILFRTFLRESKLPRMCELAHRLTSLEHEALERGVACATIGVETPSQSQVDEESELECWRDFAVAVMAFRAWDEEKTRGGVSTVALAETMLRVGERLLCRSSPKLLEDVVPAAHRREQLEMARALAVPRLVFMMLAVCLHEKWGQRALEVTVLVSDTQNNLCRSFTPTQLEQVLDLAGQAFLMLKVAEEEEKTEK